MIASYHRFLLASLQALVTLLGVAIIAYLLFHVLPEGTGSESFLRYLHNLSPIGFASKGALNPHWMLIGTLSIGDAMLVLKWPFLGVATHGNQLVGSLILEALPETIALVLSAMLLAGVVGIPLGAFAARKPNGWLDIAIKTMSSVGMAVPSFVAGLLIMWLFGYLLGDWTGLPVTGSLFEYEFAERAYVLQPQNLVLPVLALSLRPLSVTSMLMRNSIAEILSKDYIRAARAMGYTENMILFRHALVNAINPVLHGLMVWTSSLFAGSIFVEVVFGWKGLGHVLLNAIDDSDFQVMMGLMLVFSTSFIALNWVMKLVYPIFDPSLRPR